MVEMSVGNYDCLLPVIFAVIDLSVFAATHDAIPVKPASAPVLVEFGRLTPRPGSVGLECLATAAPFVLAPVDYGRRFLRFRYR